MGKTILLVEQNANLALQVAHYGYVMETGKITHEAVCKALREDDAIRRAYLGVAGTDT
jgi:branched-chain amino acid transport system ATP-binding protein